MKWIKETWKFWAVVIIILSAFFLVNLGLDWLLGPESRPEIGNWIH